MQSAKYTSFFASFRRTTTYSFLFRNFSLYLCSSPSVCAARGSSNQNSTPDGQFSTPQGMLCWVIIARTIESESGPMTELWCLADWATRMNLSSLENSYAESSMHSLEESFNAQGIMSVPARHLNRWDIPSDVPLSLPELTAMRKAAKKSRG